MNEAVAMLDSVYGRYWKLWRNSDGSWSIRLGSLLFHRTVAAPTLENVFDKALACLPIHTKG